MRAREKVLTAAHESWRADRRLPPGHWPGMRYVLLHTFAHALIRELALECGYSAAGIAERIYARSGEQPMAGVLLYTAAPDSEGTLGGLVSLGRATALARSSTRPSRQLACAAPTPSAPNTTHATGAVVRRRLPRLPIRLRDLLRTRQPLPRPGAPGRHGDRPRRRVPGAMNVAGHDPGLDAAARLAAVVADLAGELPPAHLAAWLRVLRWHAAVGPRRRPA